MDDRELLARLAGDGAGAEAAFDTIFRAWYERLVRVADAVVRDRAVAEELAQEALLELWRRRAQLAADGSPQAYLLQSARNRALNHVRHLQVQRRSSVHLAGDASREPAAPAQLEAQEIEAAVRGAVDGLTPRCREVFELSRVHGMKYAEIAQTLGVSVKAVEAQMGRALRTLRERLAPWLPGGDRL